MSTERATRALDDPSTPSPIDPRQLPVVRVSPRPRIGLALGSGGARGWAHIGVLQELNRLGIYPSVIAGCSIGALVGATYVSGHLTTLERWLRNLAFADIVRFLDINLLTGGGLIEGRRLMQFFYQLFGDLQVQELPTPMVSVATDLMSGREVWLQEGSLLDAVRASIALPGFFTPVQRGRQWLVDGGLVNPVPVSICHAMGADLVIAVNLNGDQRVRHLRTLAEPIEPADAISANLPMEMEENLFARVSTALRERANVLMSHLAESHAHTPGLFDVIAGAINIMQDRITRSRLAGDAPDLVLIPRVAQIEPLAFDRGAEAIEEGKACVRRIQPYLIDLLNSDGDNVQPAPTRPYGTTMRGR